MIIVALVVSALIVAGCSETQPKADQKEQKAQSTGYEALVNKQPAEGMAYSPTREALIKYANTWEEEGKIAYVYFSNMNGERTGYFILEGLPASYSAALTPTERIETHYESQAVIENPAMDGVYYSGSDAARYFGYDAVSGAYLEWSANGGQEFFITDQPLSNVPEAKPLGDATIEAVQQQQQ